MAINNQVRSYKIPFVLASLMAVIAIGLYLWTILGSDHKSHSSEEDLEFIQDLEIDNEFYRLLSAADEMVLIGEDYKRALSAYKNISVDDESMNSMLRKRISRVEMILQRPAEDGVVKHYETMIQSNKNSIDSLKAQLNILKSSNGNFDSLRQRVQALSSELEKKNSELNRKQLVKVISFKNDNERLIHYMGEVVNEKANGGGVGIWSTGSIYRGNWKDNKRHGSGTFEWADGMRYVGNYIDDKRSGEGNYYWPSGERYEGEWKNDMREGYGKLYDQDGNIRFEGNWKEDKPNR